ncbi:MAG: hypothetical protein JWQ30_372 [Sediminibacterium sp.]|nr:hypothetical protein [Sediminibacterium sp.]
MARKRWTPQTEITESLIRFREKRKWQLSYRRYVLERAPSESYAPYFGLDIETLRKWFELQFTDELNWDNFGKAWQFDHIVPTTYFDYSNETDLLLCWNFINIRVEKLEPGNNRGHRIDPIAVRPYFKDLYNKTGYPLCLKMLEKIAAIEVSNIGSHPAIENFIIDNRALLEHISSFDHEEFNSLNKGVTAEDVLLEREILRKFGSGQKP